MKNRMDGTSPLEKQAGLVGTLEIKELDYAPMTRRKSIFNKRNILIATAIAIPTIIYAAHEIYYHYLMPDFSIFYPGS